MTYPTIPTPDQSLGITFPGGARLQVVIPGSGAPTQLEIAKTMLGQAGPVLAGLQPVFNIIEALKSILDLAIAIPTVIVDPSDVIEATEGLASAIDKLIQTIPQLSVPLMVLGLIDTILMALEGVLVELVAAQTQLTRCSAAEATANALPVGSGRTALLAAVACSQENVAAQLTNLANGLGPINQVIAVINTLGALAGLPELVALDDLGSDPTTAIATIEGAVTALQTIRTTIPV